MSTIRSRVVTALATIVFTICLASMPGSSLATIDPDHLARESEARQLFVAVFINGDVDTTHELVDPGAAVHTDRGELLGPYGLMAWADTMRLLNPEVEPELVEVVVGSTTTTVRWHADLDGAHRHGRILMSFTGGMVTDIWLVDESQLSSIEGDGMQITELGGPPAVARAIRCTQICPY